MKRQGALGMNKAGEKGGKRDEQGARDETLKEVSRHVFVWGQGGHVFGWGSQARA